MSSLLHVARLSRTVTPVPGGKEIHVSELSSRQASDGHRVDLYVERGDAPRGVNLRRMPMVPHRVPGSAAQAWRFARSCAVSIARSSNRPDILHAHGDVGEAWALRRLSLRMDVPSVLTVHARLNSRWRWLASRLMPTIDRVIAVSESIAEDLTSCGVESARRIVIPSGLNYELLTPHLGRPIEGTDLIAVGTLNAVKNHEALLTALALVRRKHPAVRLTIVGDGRLRPQISALARTVGGTTLTGHLERSAVYQLVSRARVFVLSSTTEGTSTALLEAMALGRPCLATPEAAPRGALNRTIAVARSGTATHLADAILRLLDDDHLASRLGAAAAFAAKAYDWDLCIERVATVYNELLESRRR